MAALPALTWLMLPGSAMQDPPYLQPSLQGAMGPDPPCSQLDGDPAAGPLCDAASPHGSQGGVPAGLADAAVRGLS